VLAQIVHRGEEDDRAALRVQRDELMARIEQATEYVPIERLGLSPQCGFASTEEGNLLTEDEQWAKIREVVAIADDVWK
jgi:5-methyltetrahydropteroyltriglutamate--homocysteine methyltransferase